MTKQILNYFLMLILCAFSFKGFTQQSFRGTVTDSSGKPLAGVSIRESSKNGTLTNDNGAFNLVIQSDDNLIEVSYVGYLTQKVRYSGSPIIIQLKIDPKSNLSDVVVIGYGTQKSTLVSGAISMVKMSDVLGNRPVNDLSTLLVNAIPGLNTTVISGQPGSSIKLNVRGATDISASGNFINSNGPLIVVDNIPYTGSLNSLNPNDMESITLLKDPASSAIYGGQAAFGVLMVTTKQGKKNQKPNFIYSNNISIISPTNLPVKANAQQFLQSLVDMGTTGYWSGQNVATWMNLYDSVKKPASVYPDGVARTPSAIYPLIPHDVLKDLLGNGSQFQQNFSVTGGTEKTTYRFSFGNANQNGVIVPSSHTDYFKKYNVSSFLSSDVTDWFTAQLSSNYSNTYSSTPNNNQFYNAINYTVLMPSSDSLLPLGGQIGLNGTPANLAPAGGINTSQNSDTRIIGRGILKPFKGMTITGEYNYDHLSNNQSIYSKIIPYFVTSAGGVSATQGTGNYELYNGKDINKVLNIYGSYQYSFGYHNFKLTGGYNQQEHISTDNWAQRNGMIAPNQPSLTNATGPITAGNDYTANAVQGYFSRLEYNYKEKYILSVAGRYDGSSNFPSGHRFGFFPSLSTAWNISRENFMSALLPTLSFLKLRIDYGSVGNQAVPAYRYVPFMSSYQPNWLTGTSYLSSLGAPILPGYNYTWETAASTDFGVDFGFFHNHLTGNFDWYQRNTKNILASGAIPYPAVLGTGAPLQNTASLRVRGFEIQLNYNTNIGKDIHIRIGANLSNNSGIITKFNSNPKKSLNFYYGGQKLGEIWGYVTDGLYTMDDFVAGTLNSNLTGGTLKPGVPKYQGELANPGDVKYKDLDGDGKIYTGLNTVDSAGDRRIIGNSNPQYMYGLNSAVTFKGITFSFVITGVGKQDLPGSGQLIFPNANAFGTVMENELNYWTPTHTNSFYGRIYNQASGNQSYNQLIQTRYLQNGAYLRINNLTLDYAFPISLIKKVFIKSFHVFCSLENPFLFDHLPKGLDPQLMTSTVNISSNSGAPFVYPFIRNTSFGVNITF